MVPQFNVSTPDDATTDVTTDSWSSNDGLIPEVGGAMGVGQNNMSEEDVHEFIVMILETPSYIWGDHLLRTDAQVKRFSHQVFVYCEKKGLDISEYLFDEFGLIFSGVVLLQGMRKDHADYKLANGIKPKSKKGKKPRKTIDTDEYEISDEELEDDPRQTIGGEYKPVEKKRQPRDAGIGGDKLPAQESEPEPEMPKAAEDAGLIDFGDPDYTEDTIVRGGVVID